MSKLTKIFLAFAGIITLIMSTLVMANQTTVDTAKPKKNITYLFTLSANSAVVKPVNASAGEYSLTLNKVQPYVSYFSDRPNRITGLMPTSKFIQAWNPQSGGNFKQMAPNVDVEGIKVHGIFHQKDMFFILSLNNPQYNQTTHSLSFTATALNGDKGVMPTQTTKLHNTALFIDNSPWCPGCCCG